LQTHLNGAVRCAIEIDLFKKVPVEGATITAKELEANSGAERIVISKFRDLRLVTYLLLTPLVRLMRALTAHGIFVEVNTEKYKHNPLSMAYTAVHVRDLVKYMHVSQFLTADFSN
jgi:hypothetical protein